MGTASRRRTDGARILLVEDNEDLRLLMQMALENEGYIVASVQSAEEGMRLVETRRYDLVVTDYNLPGHSGAWLLQQALRRKLLRGAATLLDRQPGCAGAHAHGGDRQAPIRWARVNA